MAIPLGNLVEACSNGKTDLVSQYLDNIPTEPDIATIQNLLEAAAFKAHIQTAAMLLRRFPSITLTETIIRASIYAGSNALYSLFLEKDPSISKTCFERSTPLSIAIDRLQPPEFIALLLSTGADPNDPETTTSVLSRAAMFYSTPAVVALLLQHGAQLKGSKALACASSGGKLETVRYLLEAGANPVSDGLEDEMAEPALNLAVKKGHLEIARLLIKYDADPNVIDWEGRTAVEIAEREHPEMIVMLRGE